MPKLYKLILRSYIGPFIATFFITLFILLMQFLFKYIDDLVGKGLEWYIILELLLYASSTLVPLALPLAVLLSSLMTFGSLAENYELVAFKSAGVSLRRVMMPLFLFTGILSVGAFFFSNQVMPFANLKMNSLLYDVRQQKPTLTIKEGVFYSGIDGYSIRVGKKEKDGSHLKDIMIYDHAKNQGNRNVLMAKTGVMSKSENGRFLVLNLYDGIRYEETIDPKNPRARVKHVRFRFKEQEVKFDLSAFKMERTDESLFKDHYKMLNVVQLINAQDSLKVRLDLEYKELDKYLKGQISFIKKDSILHFYEPREIQVSDKGFLRTFSREKRKPIVRRALSIARNVKSFTASTVREEDYTIKKITKHDIEWHRKFTLSVACAILFFIGAPLGAIIKKGGLGLPVVVSIMFFILFHIMSISGEKFAREGILTSFSGMWLASGVLIPIGLFFTYKATTDSTLFDSQFYQGIIQKIRSIFVRGNKKNPN